MKRVIALVLSLIAGALVSFLVPMKADACQRCGIFGRGCKMQHHHVSQYVAPVVYKQPDLLVVQNNYPAPLAIQGSTQFGYQSAAAAYFVSPAQVLQQAALLATAAGQTAQLGLTGYNQTAQTQLSIQASIAEPLIKSQAAVAVLGAAGLSQPSQQQSLALRITQGTNGQWQVVQADPQQLNASVTARLGVNGSAPQAQPEELPQAPSVSSLLGTKCAKCHGAHLSEPKGQVFIDTEERLGAKLDCKIALKSLQLVKAGKMPKDETLTPEDKGKVLYELLDLAQSE